jgi:uncharacterized membrane protein
MTEITRADLHGLQRSIAIDLQNIRHDIVRLEAKIDAKPSTAALYQAVVTLMFGIGAIITSTVVVLKNIGAMG